mgnify:CR=1 FL=1
MHTDVVEVTFLAYGRGVNGEVGIVDVESVAMMSSGVIDVDPFLISWDTLGKGKTANSK